MFKKFLWFCGVLLLSAPQNLYSDDSVPTCQASYDAHQKKILSKLSYIEGRFVDYRWAELKLRDLYYNRLWHVRRDMNHPLDRERRDLAKQEEARLMDVLRDFENQSSDASNDIMHGIDELKQTQLVASKICPKYSIRECFGEAYTPFFKHLEKFEAQFNVIFEREREFRKRVSDVAAGRNGLYPDDALESSDAHEDFYWRFSKDFEPGQFKEDITMIHLLYEIHKNLTFEFKGDTCCVYCQEATT